MGAYLFQIVEGTGTCGTQRGANLKNYFRSRMQKKKEWRKIKYLRDMKNKSTVSQSIL